ncbi:MAG: glycosyltransferase family 2 protein [Patescibacteria group bacterium]
MANRLSRVHTNQVERKLTKIQQNSNKKEFKTLTFISPCYNEEVNLETLYKKLSEITLNLHQKYQIECNIFLVDDGSTDNTWEIITRLGEQDNKVKGLKLSRNFGKENALLAGYENAPQSDLYATLDADLQDDPDIIERMLEKSMEGYDIVYAQRASRQDSQLYLFFTRIFYKFMQAGSKVDFPPNVSDFHLITEKVRRSFLQMQESIRYSRGLIFFTGFKKIGVEYHRPDRLQGTSKFSFAKLVVLALDAWTSFSSLPLHLVSITGLILTVLSFLFGAGYIFFSIFYKYNVQGWASTISVILFLGSVQMVMIGVIGEYLARMNQEIKNRPKYFVDETINNQ